MPTYTQVWELSAVLYETHEEARAALGVGPAVYLARMQLAEDRAGTSPLVFSRMLTYADIC